MRKSVFQTCCAIVGVCCLVAVVYGLIDNWADTSIGRKIFTFLAILGWVDICYRLITLKYHWQHRILGEE